MAPKIGAAAPEWSLYMGGQRSRVAYRRATKATTKKPRSPSYWHGWRGIEQFRVFFESHDSRGS